jgi:hypothetical protein
LLSRNVGGVGGRSRDAFDVAKTAFSWSPSSLGATLPLPTDKTLSFRLLTTLETSKTSLLLIGEELSENENFLFGRPRFIRSRDRSSARINFLGRSTSSSSKPRLSFLFFTTAWSKLGVESMHKLFRFLLSSLI